MNVIVLSIGYNSPFDAINKNILSVQKQCTDSNVIHIVIDDGSIIDISDMVSKYSDVNFIRNNQKLGAENLLRLNNFIKTPDDIIIILDLHNWFADAYAIQTIIEYHKCGIWTTYGSYISSNAVKRRAEYIEMIPESTLKAKRHRVSSWKISMPLTFNANLWNNILIDNLKCNNGCYISDGYIIPLFYMLLDLTPYNKVKLLGDIIAVKNTYYVETICNDIFNDTQLNEIDDGKPVINDMFLMLPIKITEKDIKKYANIS